MRALRLDELHELIQSAEFTSWWAEFLRGGAELRERVERAEELQAQSAVMEERAERAEQHAADALSRAGELDGEAARLAAGAQEIENRSLECVARYEEFRFEVSDVWYRLGAAEREVEELREAIAAGAQAAKGRARQKAGALEAALAQSEEVRAALAEEYEREAKRKAALWEEVERLWDRSFASALLESERSAEAREVRRASERLFREVEERRARVRQLRQECVVAGRDAEEARGHVRTLLGAAAVRLSCLPGDRFLYWRRKGGGRGAWALALFDDAENYNLEVRALSVYWVSSPRGAGFLEPAREGAVLSAEEGDRRFEEYFLGPRKGARPAAGAESPRTE